MDREDDPVERHEHWLAEHEAMLRKYEENRLELQEEMKLTWTAIRANAELLRQVTREGDDRLRALDERLRRLADLMIGHFGGNGEGGSR